MSVTDAVPGRSPEEILAEWRAVEAAETEAPDQVLRLRIEALKAEHAAALEARSAQARQLGSPPASRQNSILGSPSGAD